MIVLNILGYFGRNKQNSYAALRSSKKTLAVNHSAHMQLSSFLSVCGYKTKYGILPTSLNNK